jgi:NAD(P)-dependent dehydrogenase (short-subunit alcohol dehydrogenase family)
MRFAGKVLLATGAGSGIAAATARRFHAEGGRVAVVDLDGERADEIARELEGSIGLQCDVADEASVEAAVAAADAQLGGIDCVVAAAGYAEFGPLEEWSLDRWNRLLAVHAGGTFLVCKYTIPRLRARGGGSIVTTSSVAAFVAQTGNAPYGAAKGAIAAFTRQLAHDLAVDGIRVNAIAPGRTRTAMTEARFVERGDGDYAAGAAKSAAFTMLKRIAEPDELAAPICFLLSDEASFITGQVYLADGGETAL